MRACSLHDYPRPMSCRPQAGHRTQMSHPAVNPAYADEVGPHSQTVAHCHIPMLARSLHDYPRPMSCRHQAGPVRW